MRTMVTLAVGSAIGSAVALAWWRRVQESRRADRDLWAAATEPRR